jgi:hypothetical protein
MGFKIDSGKSWKNVGKKSISANTYKPVVQAKSYEGAEVIIEADTYKPIVEAKSYEGAEVLIEAETYKPAIEAETYKPIIEEKSYTPIVQESTYTGKTKKPRKPRTAATATTTTTTTTVEDTTTVSEVDDTVDPTMSLYIQAADEDDSETMVIASKSKKSSNYDDTRSDYLLYSGIGLSGAFLLMLLLGGDRR